MRDYDGKTAAERVSERRDKLIPLCLTKPGPNPQPNSDFRSMRTLAHRPGRQGAPIHQMKTEQFAGNPPYSILPYSCDGPALSLQYIDCRFNTSNGITPPPATRSGRGEQ